MNSPARMDIYSPPGTTVTFDAGGGYPAEQASASKILQLGKQFVVVETNVHAFHSTVTLSDVHGFFNSALFAQYPEILVDLNAATHEPQPDAITKLAVFGIAVLDAHRDHDGPCDLDGGTLQGLAVEAGVLEQRNVTKPCGENCACGQFDGIPGICFFTAADVAQFIKEVK